MPSEAPSSSIIAGINGSSRRDASQLTMHKENVFTLPVPGRSRRSSIGVQLSSSKVRGGTTVRSLPAL